MGDLLSRHVRIPRRNRLDKSCPIWRGPASSRIDRPLRRSPGFWGV